VAGVTKKLAHRGWGSNRDNADSTARSAGSRSGRLTLPTQDRNLMTQDKNLDLFGPLAAQTEQDQLHDLTQEQVPTRQDHARRHFHQRPTDSHKIARQQPLPSSRTVHRHVLPNGSPPKSRSDTPRDTVLSATPAALATSLVPP
jgi:hypothetical protein